MLVGSSAGQSLLSGGNNVVLGTYAALYAQCTNAVVIGTNAGQSVNAQNCVFMGYQAGSMYSGGLNSMAMGTNTAYAAGGDNCTYLGTSAAYAVSGDNNVAIGYNAGASTTFYFPVSMQNSLVLGTNACYSGTGSTTLNNTIVIGTNIQFSDSDNGSTIIAAGGKRCVTISNIKAGGTVPYDSSALQLTSYGGGGAYCDLDLNPYNGSNPPAISLRGSDNSYSADFTILQKTPGSQTNSQVQRASASVNNDWIFDDVTRLYGFPRNYASGGASAYAGIAGLGHATAGTYAIQQDAGGRTYLNASDYVQCNSTNED